MATVVVAAIFITIIDATVVNVALPTIDADLGAPVELTATVTIGFLVAMAVAIPLAGWLGDRLGAREVFLAAVTLFTVASAACGFAATVQQLVIFRIVHGLGGGLMTPVGMAMLYRTFPPSERVRLSPGSSTSRSRLPRRSGRCWAVSWCSGPAGGGSSGSTSPRPAGSGAGHPRGGPGVIDRNSRARHEPADGRVQRTRRLRRTRRLAPAVRVPPPAPGTGHEPDQERRHEPERHHLVRAR